MNIIKTVCFQIKTKIVKNNLDLIFNNVFI